MLKGLHKDRSREYKRTYLKRMICITLLVLAIPILLLAYQSYQNASEASREQLRVSTETALQQFANTLSLVMDNLNLQYQQLTMSEPFRQYLMMADGVEMEKNRPPYQDLKKNYNYVMVKGALRDLVRQYSENNALVCSCYLYDANKDVVLSSHRLDSSIESFEDTDFLPIMYKQNVKFPYLLPPRMIADRQGDSTLVISAVFRTFAEGGKISFVANIDADMLVQTYADAGQLQASSALFVADWKDTVFFGIRDGKMLDPSEYSQYLPSDMFSLFSGTTISKEGVILSRVPIYKLGWDAFLVNRGYDYFGISNSVVQRIILLSLLAFFLTAAVTVFINIKLYAPISTWMHHLRGENRHMGRADQWLIRGTEVEVMGQWIQISSTALRSRFWLKVIMGDIPDMKNYTHVHFRIKLFDFLLAVVVISDAGLLEDGDKVIACSTMAQLIRESFETDTCEVVEMDDNTLLVLVNCSQQEYSQRVGELVALHKQIATMLQLTSGMAVGGFCSDLPHAKETYNKAMLTLRYQNITGIPQTQYTMIMESSLGTMAARLWEMEKSLETTLAHESYGKAREALLSMRGEMEKCLPQMDYFQIKHCVMSILNIIVDTLQQEHGAINRLAGLPDDLYQHVLGIEDISLVWQVFYQILDAMEQQLPSSTPPATKNCIALVMQMINEGCGKDMGLTQISERLGLSSVYISKMFKRETRENYTQYLTRKRMEKARQLLTESDLQIQEISLELGYSQSHYFSRVFRQYYGMTPSDYLEHFKEQKASDCGSY